MISTRMPVTWEGEHVATAMTVEQTLISEYSHEFLIALRHFWILQFHGQHHLLKWGCHLFNCT
jgi:hypothetical protein